MPDGTAGAFVAPDGSLIDLIQGDRTAHFTAP
jgi:hypothetical protein